MTAHIKDFIEQEFYHFHSHPELSYQEFETTKRLKEDLEKNGIKILPLDLKTGVVAEIGQGDTTVAIRADIDALPVQENTALPYKSTVSGIMHACGHDSHAATILGAALLLKEHEKDKYAVVAPLMKNINEGKQMKDVWTGPLTSSAEKKFGKHPTQKPLYLLERIILASTKEGDIVLDPFCGSSTTGVACRKLGRFYIGIDNCIEYIEISKERITHV